MENDNPVGLLRIRSRGGPPARQSADSVRGCDTSHGPAETFFEIHFRFVAQKCFRPGNVGERVLNISGALGAVFHVAVVSDQFLQNQESLVQISPPAGGHVDYFSRDLAGFGPAGQQICRDDIFDVGEIAALLAVAKNGGLFPAQHLSDEFGQNTRVRRSRILPRAKHVEISQANSLQAVTTVKTKSCNIRWPAWRPHKEKWGWAACLPVWVESAYRHRRRTKRHRPRASPSRRGRQPAGSASHPHSRGCFPADP